MDRESIGGEPWTVGPLVPNRYESLLRLHPPDPTPDGWWELYRDLFVLVASLGASYTTTPTRAWFAIWEGHGFDKTSRTRTDRPPCSAIAISGAIGVKKGETSEYVRDLIRRDQERERLRSLLLDGAASSPGPIADDSYFESLRTRVRAAG